MALFHRSQKGYELTAAGHELWVQAQPMQNEATRLENWRITRNANLIVRIACGEWTARFIAQHVPQTLLKASDPCLKIVPANAFLNMKHREADLAIRNQRPQQPGLIMQKMGVVEFAIYGQSNYVSTHPEARSVDRYTCCSWVAPTSDNQASASTRWLYNHLVALPRVLSGSALVTLESIASGAGLGVLPRFVGDSHASLLRVSESISDLTHNQYLVAHQEDRSLPHIRRVKRSIVALLNANRSSFGPQAQR